MPDPFDTKKGPCRSEKRCIRQDGKTVWIDSSRSALVDANGECKAILEVAVDITERRRLEEQLRQSAKMEAIGQLAGGVAHDFNNILTAIIGYADLLSNELPAEGPYRQQVLQITRAAEGAVDLTRQLLAFSRKQVLDVKATSLNRIISDTEGLLRRLIDKKIELVTVLSPSQERVLADPVQIQQILMNLVVNARDAMPGGGKLTVETDNAYLSRGVRSHSS